MDSPVLYVDQYLSELKRATLFKPYGFFRKNGQNLKYGRITFTRQILSFTGRL